MLDFRLYTPDDIGGCLDLIREGHDKGFSAERFRWLHHDGPGGPSDISLATDGDRIVGFYSVVRKVMQAGELTFTGGRDVDPVVHMDYRGQGLFSRLLEFSLSQSRDADFYYNFANPASAPGFRKRGWRELSRLDDQVRQLGYSHIASREFGLWLLGRLAPARPTGNHIREISTEELQELLSADNTPRLMGNNHLQVVRNSEYLRWRYLLNPLHSYRYFLLGDSEAWGLSIVRHEEEVNRLMIVDYADFGIVPQIRNFLPLWASTFPAALVLTWSTIPAELRIGCLANPLRRGKGQALLAREVSKSRIPPDFWDPTAWMISHGDLEIT